MRLRIGVIGLGEWWETRHRPALRSLVDRYEVRAVSSAVSLLAEQAAQDFQCTPVDGFHSVASRWDIDAVLMLGREWYGPLPILAACHNGKAVYCSTALEMPARQAWDIKQQVDRSGVAFMAELPRRQSPATLRLKELIATHLGPPSLIFCHQRAGCRRSDPSTQGAAETTMSEQVDWCRYVMDRDVAGVEAVEHRKAGPRGATSDGKGATGEMDYRMLTLDFVGSKQLAHISYGNYISPQWPEAAAFRPPADLQVCCEKGVAFVDLPARVTWFDEAGRHHESLEHDRPVGEQLLNIFHRSVTSLVRRTSGLDDAYSALRILEAARQSAAERKRVPL